MNTESFERRHIGPTDIEIDKMLNLINANFINQVYCNYVRNYAK